MVRIDFKNFIYDRAWFGWYHLNKLEPTGWVRGTNGKIHWKIKKIRHLGEFIIFDED